MPSFYDNASSSDDDDEEEEEVEFDASSDEEEEDDDDESQEDQDGQPSDSDEDDDDDNDVEESWGKTKKTYWEGDTADLEIGQDVEDAEEEELAAKELHQKMVKRTTKADYSGDYDDDSEEEVETRTKSSKSTKQLKSKDISSQKSSTKSLESAEVQALYDEVKEKLADLNGKILPLAKMFREWDQAHPKQSNNNEPKDDLVQYLEMKQQMLYCYCTNLLFYALMKVEGKSVKNHPVMKQLLELRYCLEKLRSLDSKLKPQIDRLLKYVKLHQDSTGSSNGTSNGKSLSAEQKNELKRYSMKANPYDLLHNMMDDNEEEEEENGKHKKHSNKQLSKDKKHSKHASDEEEDDEMSDIEEDDEEEEEEEDDESNKGDENVYKAPKMSAAIYKEQESAAEKTQRRMEKQARKVKNSELLASLREEFGSAPEESSSSGVGAEKSTSIREIEENIRERKDFEEDRFVRLALTRKDKQAMKKLRKDALTGGANANNFLVDIGDVGELDELVTLNKKHYSGSNGDTSMTTGGGDMEDDNDDSAVSDKKNSKLAMKLSKKLVESSNNSTKKGKNGEEDSRRRAAPSDTFGSAYDDDDHFNHNNSKKKGGKAVKFSSMQGDNSDNSDDDNNLLEEFSKRKRAYHDEQTDLHMQYKQPRFGGEEYTLEEGDKRKASKEILKNRGLVPHRKKENKNPRVKKRHQYDKAIIARKGQVREVQKLTSSYGGEITGIKDNISRSRRFE